RFVSSDGVVKFRQLFRRRCQVGVENHQNVFRSQFKSSPHCVAFPFTSLLCKDKAMSAFVTALGLLNSFPRVIGGIAFDEDNLVLWSHHRATSKNIADVSRFIAYRHNNRNRGRCLEPGFERARDYDVEHGEKSEKRQRSEITI